MFIWISSATQTEDGLPVVSRLCCPACRVACQLKRKSRKIRYARNFWTYIPLSLSSSLGEYPVFSFLVSSFTCREKRFGGREAQAAKAQYESTYGCQEPINRLLRLRNFQNGRHYKKFAWELRYSQEFSIKYALPKLLGVIPVWLFSRFRRFHLSRVYRKFMRVFIFSNLLPEFPYKSFLMTAILKITIESLFRQASTARTLILSLGYLWLTLRSCEFRQTAS